MNTKLFSKEFTDISVVLRENSNLKLASSEICFLFTRWKCSKIDFGVGCTTLWITKNNWIKHFEWDNYMVHEFYPNKGLLIFKVGMFTGCRHKKWVIPPTLTVVLVANFKVEGHSYNYSQQNHTSIQTSFLPKLARTIYCLQKFLDMAFSTIWT